jgi:hypothetical protein
MKKAALILLLLASLASAGTSERLDPAWGDPLKIDPSKPPQGRHIIQILLENQSLLLKGTGCGSDIPNDRRTLQHKLALSLGDAIDSKRHQALISGGCKPAQFELRSGAVIDAWHCTLTVVEKTAKGGFVASSSIDFGVKKDTWEIIPEAIRCM